MPTYEPSWPPSGPSSIANVIAVAHYSKIPILAGGDAISLVYPEGNVTGNIRVTSTFRSGNSDYHDYGLAVDFAASMDDAGQRLMRRLSEFWYMHSSWLLELIHTTPFDDDNGFYVKRGAKVGPNFYGPVINAQHLNHVHVAMSNRAAEELLHQLRG